MNTRASFHADQLCPHTNENLTQQQVALMIVSMVCPCRNEISHIDTFLLDCAHQQADEFELEIIVADGESTTALRKRSQRGDSGCREER